MAKITAEHDGMESVVLDVTEPEANEICLENVKFLRFAEATGAYDDALAMLSRTH